MGRGFRIAFISVLGAVFFWLWYSHSGAQLVQRGFNQLFQFDLHYFWDTFRKPAGFSIFIGESLVSLFYSSLIASLVLTFLFLLGIFLCYKIFRKFGDQVFSLVVAVIPNFVYALLLINSFYYVSGYVAYLFGIFCFYLYITYRKQRSFLLFVTFLSIVLYWFAGAALYMFFGLVTVYEVCSFSLKGEKISKPHWSIAVVILVSVFIPLIGRNTLFLDNLLQSYVSRAFYKVPVYFPLELVMTLILPSVLMLLVFWMKGKQWMRKSYVLLAGVAIAVAFVLSFIFISEPEQELKSVYDDLVYQQEWDEIIQLARDKGGTDDAANSVAINLALAMKGKLTTRFFEINNLQPVFHLFYERRGMTPFISCEPYFHLGLNNFARMMATESLESTVDAKLPSRTVKRVAETFMVSKDSINALKYLGLLKNSPEHGSWARKNMKLLKSEGFSGMPPFYNGLSKFLPEDDFYYNANQFHVALIHLLRSNVENRLAYEYLMMHFLLEKDFDSFLKYISIYPAMEYKEVPTIFQEAKAYIKTLDPESVKETDYLPVSGEIRNRLQMYAQKFTAGGRKNPAMMKKEFGDTYWYYLHFGGDEE